MIRQALVIAALCAATPAVAGEVYGGAYVHDIRSPFTLSGVESGLDFHLGYRMAPMRLLKLQPYAFASLNSAGNTHYAAVGLSRRFTVAGTLYVRPGLCLALHSGSAGDYDIPGNGEVEFGSRVLFEPELAVGLPLTDRLSVEASLVHLSHAQLFGPENPGIDNLGVRVNLKL